MHRLGRTRRRHDLNRDRFSGPRDLDGDRYAHFHGVETGTKLPALRRGVIQRDDDVADLDPGSLGRAPHDDRADQNDDPALMLCVGPTLPAGLQSHTEPRLAILPDRRRPRWRVDPRARRILG